MRDRTKTILEASLWSFIKTGRPVTSDFLYEHYDFGIKPAMIRWELNYLGEAGFMTQVHVSGGRVPTNKAYRFLVNSLLDEKMELERTVSEELALLVKEFLEGERKSFIERVANYLRVASIGYEPRGEAFYESGLKFLLARLETEEKEVLLEVVDDIESIENRLRRIEIKERGPRVFIGEGPFTKSDHLALIVNKFKVERKPFLLLAVGPKRMDYRRSLRFFRVLENSLKGGIN
jgi:heat-inducible transcriptional repressor